MNTIPFILSLLFYVAVAAGIRKTIEAIDIFLIINIRYVFHFSIAAALAALIGWRANGDWSFLLRPKDWKIQSLRSISAFGGTTSFLFTGYFLPISLTNCLALAFRPIIILLLGLIPRFREKIYKKKWVIASCATTIVGVFIMFHAHNKNPQATPMGSISLREMILGTLVILTNELFTTFGYHLNRAAAKSGESKWTTLTFSALFGALFSGFLLLLLPQEPSPQNNSSNGIFANGTIWLWLSVVIVLSIGAQLLQQISSGKLPTSTLSYLSVLQPVIGGVFDLIFFGVLPTPWMFTAMLVLMSASFLGIPSLLESKRQAAIESMNSTYRHEDSERTLESHSEVLRPVNASAKKTVDS
ncbi:MAG: DMT family transporter [Comamonas sp.]